MKCIGPVIIDKEKYLNLNLMSNGYDNNNNRYQINLKRNSVEDAGIARVIYINRSGRYFNITKKECTYAIKCLNQKVGFYKQTLKTRIF